MALNLEIDYETADKITVENMYETYESLHKQLMLGGLHHEDRIRYEEVLDALDAVCTWFDIEVVAQDRIAKIKQNVQEEIILNVYEEKLKRMGQCEE